MSAPLHPTPWQGHGLHTLQGHSLNSSMICLHTPITRGFYCFRLLCSRCATYSCLRDRGLLLVEGLWVLQSPTLPLSAFPCLRIPCLKTGENFAPLQSSPLEMSPDCFVYVLWLGLWGSSLLLILICPKFRFYHFECNIVSPWKMQFPSKAAANTVCV